jgi:hypothetical protein
MTDGGGTGTGGPATTNCEIYDPATNTFSPTGNLLQPRMGHGLTVLQDGRVLATGGLPDWTNAGPNFQAVLNGAQDTTEIWDGTTGQWTAGPVMASKRAGQTQTTLPNGQVLIVGGVSGGTTITHPLGQAAVPVLTGSVEIYDPTTGAFVPGPSIPFPRGFHAASVLANGDVLVTGGAAAVGPYGEAAATSDCRIFDGTAWQLAPFLRFGGVAFHTQVASPRTGAAIITGGMIGNFAQLQGTSITGIHDGATYTELALYGTNLAVPGQGGVGPGTHACVALHDGTLLMTGGALSAFFGPLLTDRAFLFIEP